jgi:phosphate transport system substrate-binding protein
MYNLPFTIYDFMRRLSRFPISALFYRLLPAVYCLLFIGCGGGNTKKSAVDGPTFGTVRVVCESSYEPIMKQEKDVFESFYQDAQINVSYGPESDVIRWLMQDSTRFAIMNRKLTPEEESIILQTKVDPQYLLIAYDAVALIIHPDNLNDKLSVSQLRDIFSGKIRSWKELSSDSKQDSINIVFDHPGSGNARYIKETFLEKNQNFPSNVFAQKTNPEVVDYVSKHPGSIGIIGANWVSDKDDSLTVAFMKQIKTVAVSKDESPDQFYRPYQAYVADEKYPLVREVYIIKREAGAGLGTGFAAFIAGEKGQRIILKAGMVPGTMPVRIIQINKE